VVFDMRYGGCPFLSGHFFIQKRFILKIIFWIVPVQEWCMTSMLHFVIHVLCPTVYHISCGMMCLCATT
jgi:hypothetical protein